MLKPGDSIPDITLDAPAGKRERLRDRVGSKALVVYFYPKDETAGCTAEACSFRDAYEDFTEAGADVIGISADSVASHERFAGRHRLPFTLLSDNDGAARKAFGVSNGLFGFAAGRVTFVFDREGKVRHSYDSMLRFNAHVDEALRAVRDIAAGR